MEDFYGLGVGGTFFLKTTRNHKILEFSMEDIKKIVKLRVDL